MVLDLAVSVVLNQVDILRRPTRSRSSFRIGHGEILGLVGESGSGKSEAGRPTSKTRSGSNTVCAMCGTGLRADVPSTIPAARVPRFQGASGGAVPVV
jgi:ABC-type glutathione transport system ATPase component